jgi:hypothetical protein
MPFSSCRCTCGLEKGFSCSNNLNQYAKRANETGSIYTEDIKDLQNRQNEIREITKEILARLATIQ